MKKRWIALSLTLSMSAMLFAGCGKEEQPKEDTKPSSSPTSAGEKDNNSSEDEGKKEENGSASDDNRGDYAYLCVLGACRKGRKRSERQTDCSVYECVSKY